MLQPLADRYACQRRLPAWDVDAQQRLANARAVVVGVGATGSTVAECFARAGVGALRLIDRDVLELSNLQRQVIHDTSKVGSDKVESAQARIAEINPDVRVVATRERLVRDRALGLISAHDVVADGSDNFATRYLVNDACYFAKRPLVSAAIMRFDGQITTFKAHERGPEDPTAHPCQRCVFPTQPEDPKQGCADMGVMGALAGTLGAMQASEVIKELLGIGESMSGRLLLYDSLASVFREVKVQADPACPLCGPEASLHALSDVEYGDDARTCAA